ncbi:MAG: Na+/H+ antiporter subunit E, partial [Acidimicrobiaceae bacterium]|nr:Na+/H+ antiporter subunit E [Acidimicrobiaceae bacterium]
PRWLLPALGVPVAIIADAARVLAAALRRTPGRFVRLAIGDGAGEGTLARGRRAAATVLITVTPGTIVADIDAETGEATLHTLADGRPRMEEVVAR